MENEEKTKFLKDRLRAVGFISAAALAEPDEELSKWVAKLAARYLDSFLQHVDTQEDRETVEEALEAFAIEAYQTLHL